MSKVREGTLVFFLAQRAIKSVRASKGVFSKYPTENLSDKKLVQYFLVVWIQDVFP